MKTVLLLLAITALNVHARIGETLAQVETRFGKSVRTVLEDAVEPAYLFRTEAWEITCVFRQDRCVYECYQQRIQTSNDTGIDRATAEKMLKSFSDGKLWTVGKPTTEVIKVDGKAPGRWKLGEMEAIYAREADGAHGQFLCIYTPLYLTSKAFKTFGGKDMGLSCFFFLPPEFKPKKPDPLKGL